MAIVYANHGGQFNPGTMTWSKYYIVWFTLQFVGSIYSWIWDCYMDWGCWRTKNPELYGLRDHITYPKWVYYFFMLQDLYLRLFWMIPVFMLKTDYPWLGTIGFSTMTTFLELWRRWCWTLIKIENENIHNFEKYRDVTEIPFYDDIQEENQAEEAQYSAMIKNVLTQIRTSKSLDTQSMYTTGHP